MASGLHGGAELFFEDLVPALARAGVTQSAVIRRYPTRAAKLAAAGRAVADAALRRAARSLFALGRACGERAPGNRT